MHHHLIALSPALSWSTLDERLAGETPDLARLPADYVAREDAFVDVGRRFLAAFGGGGRFTYRFFTVFEAHPDARDPGAHPLLYAGLGSDEDIGRTLGAASFSALALDDRLRLFRLAARDLLAVCIESDDGLRLSTVDDAFYWFVSLPDDCPVSSLVGEGAVVRASIAIFDPA